MSASIQAECSGSYAEIKLVKEEYNETRGVFAKRMIYKWSSKLEHNSRYDNFDQHRERQRQARKRMRQSKSKQAAGWQIGSPGYLFVLATATLSIACVLILTAALNWL